MGQEKKMTVGDVGCVYGSISIMRSGTVIYAPGRSRRGFYRARGRAR